MTPKHDMEEDRSISEDSIRVLEHSTLKVPYEALNKKYRQTQKSLEKETLYLNQSLSSLRNNSSIDSVNQALDSVVEKLRAFKRKAEEYGNEELDAVRACKRRLEHLKGATEYKSNQFAISAWKKKRFDRMLVDHFLRNGCYESAAKLVEQYDLYDLTNVNLFTSSRKIEDSLLAGNTSVCLDWCYENKTKLRRINSTLELKLRQQEFIELIKQDKRLEAVIHARKYLNLIDDEQREDLEHIMCLIAMPLDTDREPYKSLLSPSRWFKLCEKFREENYNLFQLGSSSVFSVALQAGLSSLKTKQCCRRSSTKNPECPLCCPTLNKLADSLPYPHCQQSKLICAITGHPLDENNRPFMLPNGNIYGEIGLMQITDKKTGKLICPRTKEECDADQLKRVYVM